MREEGMIWLGCNKADPRYCVKGQGWLPLAGWDESSMVANTRMHLTQSQVRDLLPALQYFAEHGYLPLPDDGEAS